MKYYSESFEKLVESLTHLPGIGLKSAGRIAFYIVNAKKEDMINLGQTIIEACEKVKHCLVCNNITDEDICYICRDQNRDKSKIMVVENERDLIAYEKTGEYKGLYHVLGGAISPLLSIGPNELKIKELMKRLVNIDEVIIATNSSIEGETTATYLIKLIKPLGIKLTRIASGVPVGGDIENIDEITLLRAYKGRVSV